MCLMIAWDTSLFKYVKLLNSLPRPDTECMYIQTCDTCPSFTMLGVIIIILQEIALLRLHARAQVASWQ